MESLYGQDLDSGQHGSGFPLPPYRQRLLEEHLAKVLMAEAEAAGDEAGKQQAAEAIKPRVYTPDEKAYSEHPWNINNLTRCKVRPCCVGLLLGALGMPGGHGFWYCAVGISSRLLQKT